MSGAEPYIAAAGLALAAVGTVGAGISQASAANYQASVNRNNAETAANNARYAREAGAVETELAGRRAAAQEARVRAGIAANNVDVDSGSAADVQRGERQTGYLSQETVANNAVLAAYGYGTAGAGYRAQAGLLSGEAGTAIPGSVLSAGGKLASNAALLPKFGGWSSNSESPTTFGGITDQLPAQY